MNKLGRAIIITAIAAGSGLVVAGPASANVPLGCETVIYNTVGKARCTAPGSPTVLVRAIFVNPS